MRGYSAPTMLQIAKAAGIQRSTLYTHFRDKEEILAAIAADYALGLRDLVENLPGPAPSMSEIRQWIGALASFAREQRAPTQLLLTASSMAPIPEPMRTFSDTFARMLAAQLPVFDTALRHPGSLTQAWAMATLRELGWALWFYAQNGDGEECANRLSVAASLFDRFVRNEC